MSFKNQMIFFTEQIERLGCTILATLRLNKPLVAGIIHHLEISNKNNIGDEFHYIFVTTLYLIEIVLVHIFAKAQTL